MPRAWLLGMSLIVAALATPAVADDKRDCLGHKDEDVRIKTCSAIIDRDPYDAIAHHNRGLAYRTKGDLDRAIADYTRAIELNPKYSVAYESRGRVYASKGDYVHAIADVTTAAELVPKGVPNDAGISSASLKAKSPAPVPNRFKAKAVSQLPQKARTVAPASESVIQAAPDNLWPAWALRLSSGN